MRLLLTLAVCVLGAQALDKNPKVLEDRTFAEKSPDGQNIQVSRETPASKFALSSSL
jgi:hypothetical protein